MSNVPAGTFNGKPRPPSPKAPPDNREEPVLDVHQAEASNREAAKIGPQDELHREDGPTLASGYSCHSTIFQAKLGTIKRIQYDNHEAFFV